MIIQYISDIHLEFKNLVINKLLKNINADVLIMAGDICAMGDKEDFGKFINLVKYYSPKYKYIIHVAGNHEFYTTTKSVTKADCMDAVNRKLKAVSKLFSNYIYLNCDATKLVINNKPYMFIGATLWTKIQKKYWDYIQHSMNDYSNIYINKNNTVSRFTVSDMQRLHTRHKSFIKTAISKAATMNIPTVVITHHKPVVDEEVTDKNLILYAYETDITHLFRPPVKVVIWGHTHKHYQKSKDGIIYVSNPKGYPSQHCGYKPDLGIYI